MFSEIKDAIKESIQLAGRVETLCGQVSELSVQVREDHKDIKEDINGLNERIVRIEALIEYTTMFSNQKKLENN